MVITAAIGFVVGNVLDPWLFPRGATYAISPHSTSQAAVHATTLQAQLVIHTHRNHDARR
jgi:hypothetical protein